MIGTRLSRTGLLTNMLVLALAVPLVAAEPEILDRNEATVFVNGNTDYFEFSGGLQRYAGATWIIRSPDWHQISFTRSAGADAGEAQRWTLEGSQTSGEDLWEAIGDLSGAAADGTWTIEMVGFYYSIDDQGVTSSPAATLSIQGRAIHFGTFPNGVGQQFQTWNWHETSGTWNEPSTVPQFNVYTVDSPIEGPEEDPQYARFFTPDPNHQSIPGTTQSQTIPAQSLDTPPITTPATCTLGPCTLETPVDTPAVPIPRVCAPLDLVCAGPVLIPSEHIADIPAICDAAGFACIPAQFIPSEHLGDTPEIILDVDFTGLDVFADPNAGELTLIGPFHFDVGPVPVDVCASTCPFPVPPEGSTLGDLTVTVTIDGVPYSQTVPLNQSF